MGWGEKIEFTLKTAILWDILQDVVGAKFPSFQKNMLNYYNNFHKDVARPSCRKVDKNIPEPDDSEVTMEIDY